MEEQQHLGYADTVNFGSYYTPMALVDKVYELLAKHINQLDKFKIVDTSCGYGSFLRSENSIGADYDAAALAEAKKNISSNRLYCHNSLKDVGRAQYALSSEEQIIIVGNPPYNDTTSIIRNDIKKDICEIDQDLKHRDMGVSFLLSYAKLAADYICVLHPLSYLIKKANFESLGLFKKNYVLIDGLIISSGEFSATSKTTHFPIIIALYKRDSKGMDYAFIKKYAFKTKEGSTLRLDHFDSLGNYITKYPNHRKIDLEHSVAFFWTMRDINALKRTKTFIERENNSTIRIPKEKLSLYCYADIFKEYIPHIPYYLGNNDVMIDIDAFKKIEPSFMRRSLSKYAFLRHLLLGEEVSAADTAAINEYFKNMLGEHYVDKKSGS